MLRSTVYWWLGLSCAAALLLPGCGRPKAPAPRAQTTQLPLPWWAPKHPSPEFLRAAKVIRAWPEEVAPGDFVARSYSERYRRTLPAAWEVFGTLTDEQIQHLLQTKDLHIRFTDLTKKQRTALFHYLEVFRTTFEGTIPPEGEGSGDPLVDLYKTGARQDLSNVDVGFFIRRGSSTLVMDLRPKRPDGTLGPHNPAGLGLVYDKENGE